MCTRPLAYHITFGTYGTRLHGDERGTIDRKMNQPGDPIIGSDLSLWQQERDRMPFPPVVLDAERMRRAEFASVSVCERGGWHLHVCAAGPDHFHILLSPGNRPDADPEKIRRWFKRWLGEAMSARWSLLQGAAWWAEGGCIRYVWSQAYFDNVFDYLRRQRATRP